MRLREWLARRALFFFLVAAVAVALWGFTAGCDATYTVTSDCLYPDSVVMRDGKLVTYWPEGCP